MTLPIDRELGWLLVGALVLLVVSSAIGFVLSKRRTNGNGAATIANLNARIRAWWVMCAVIAAAVLAGNTGSAVLFAAISFLALREFVTLIPIHHGDHRALLWLFFIITPIQYWLVWTQWYGLFVVFIPVYAFLLLPARSAMAGDTSNFLERTATIQWALMICVYCVSHAPALLALNIPGFAGQNAQLLLFLVFVVEGSDVFQYVWGKLFGKRKIAPVVSPNKTWEGFIGGIASATLLGGLLWWATPFAPWQAAVMALVIALMGFAGGLTMSAIKRDRGIKDFGGLIAGHGGILDRIDSLCFAAPVFFHLTRYFFHG
ncbi:MAG: phosphatidate cytidylyltransferase [Thermomicrobiales bacterium]